MSQPGSAEAAIPRSQAKAAYVAAGAAVVGLLLASSGRPTPAGEHVDVQRRVTTYAITATSGAGALRQMATYGPWTTSGRAIALTHCSLSWERTCEDCDGGAVVTRSSPRVVVSTELPACPDCGNGAWKRFAGRVRVHEQLHVGVCLDELQALLDNEVKTGATCASIDADNADLFSALQAGAEAADAAVDGSEPGLSPDRELMRHWHPTPAAR